ncbi:MAG: 4-hydroxy-tetrahydrodipicolinate reductase, partial [Candidatus Omnitrophica bacterium]|nr:4-hydroxy-tetrahydrodipicolinate reductase [Candidatus Omnitrophota bacterium]
MPEKLTPIVIHGAAGRMGLRILALSLEDSGVEVRAALEREGHPDLGKDAAVLAGLDAAGIELQPASGYAAEGQSVFIDFTLPESTARTVQVCAESGNPLVIGTTGIAAEGRKQIEKAAERIPIVWAPNMSVGMNLLFEMVRKVASQLGPEYDIEIIEAHHNKKVDAPSGTALRLAEKAAEGRAVRLDDVAIYGRQGHTGPRPAGEIGIHTVRAGDIVGEHTVCFVTGGERLELTHRASS